MPQRRACMPQQKIPRASTKTPRAAAKTRCGQRKKNKLYWLKENLGRKQRCASVLKQNTNLDSLTCHIDTCSCETSVATALKAASGLCVSPSPISVLTPVCLSTSRIPTQGLHGLLKREAHVQSFSKHNFFLIEV